MSVDQHQGSTRPTVDLTGGDSDDEEFQRVIAMSAEESRASKRQKRQETPEEERKLLAECATHLFERRKLTPFVEGHFLLL